MAGKPLEFEQNEVDALILRSLVRKFVVKGVLSPENVRALLFDAAEGLHDFGGTLTAEAARRMVDEEWARGFFPRR